MAQVAEIKYGQKVMEKETEKKISEIEGLCAVEVERCWCAEAHCKAGCGSRRAVGNLQRCKRTKDGVVRKSGGVSLLIAASALGYSSDHN